MKHSFPDTSYIEVILSPGGKVLISLGANNPENPLEVIVNSVEISPEDFKELISDIIFKN